LEASGERGHGGGIFREGATVQKDVETELRGLHAQIGQLTVEKDFLERAFAKR